jgi:hypothetical protein
VILYYLFVFLYRRGVIVMIAYNFGSSRQVLVGSSCKLFKYDFSISWEVSTLVFISYLTCLLSHFPTYVMFSPKKREQRNNLAQECKDLSRMYRVIWFSIIHGSKFIFQYHWFLSTGLSLSYGLCVPNLIFSFQGLSLLCCGFLNHYIHRVRISWYLS